MSNDAKDIRPALRRRIIKTLAVRDGYKCHYCGVPLEPCVSVEYKPNGASLDHIIPRNDGGDTTLDNLVLACRRCNRQKATQHYQEFRFAIESDGAILFLMGGEI